MKKHFPIIIEQDEDGYYIVSCSSFKGCNSYGSTIEEALTNIKEAIQLCIETEELMMSDNVFVGIRDLEVEISEFAYS